MSKVFIVCFVWLLQFEIIDELLCFFNDVNEEIECFLGLEENIVGDVNKCKLVGYVCIVLGFNKIDQYFVCGEGCLFECMLLMILLQICILCSKFCEEDKMDLVQMIDQLGMKIIDDIKIFNVVEVGF